jgi:hypothetical protein
MKRALLILAVLVLVSVVGCAQEIIVADMVTLYWDAATTDINGDLLLSIDTVEYDVYLDDGTANDPQDIAQLMYLGRVSAPQMVMTLPNRAVWYLGARVVITTAGVPVYGLIGWSIDEPPITQDGPFAVVPNLDGAPMVRQLRAEE